MKDINFLYTAFREKAEAVSAQVHRVGTRGEAGMLVAELLARLGSNKIAISLSSLSREAGLENLLRGSGLEVFTANLRVQAPLADVGMSQLDMAVAETGTLVGDATNVDDRLVSTLPLVHVALVSTSGLKATLGEALEALQEKGIPGQINFITGPSRTSDIERVLTIGVHGPEKLIIVFVDQEDQGDG